MNIKQITEAVIEAIKRDYYLVPRKEDLGSFVKIDFIESVINFVCIFNNVEVSAVKSALRLREYVESRYYIYHIIEKHSKVMIEKQMIGSLLNRDKSTVHAGFHRCHDLIKCNREFRSKLQQCESAFLEQYGK